MDRKKKIITLVLIGWVLCIIVIGAIVVAMKLKRKNMEEKREAQVQDMAEQIISNGQKSFKVDPNSLPVAGEEFDEFEEETPVITTATSGSAAETDTSAVTSEDRTDLVDPNDVQKATKPTEAAEENTSSEPEYELISYGTISIPSIDCEIPLWEGAGKIELRYGAGRMPLSADAGENGNLVIYGHRMRAYGSLFNRLGDVQIGDSISITRLDGSTFTYYVDQIEIIEPSEITKYIEMDDGGCRITLITCTPIGVGTQRLLVIGHMG